MRRPFLCCSSKSCGELRLSLDLALDAKDELVDVTFAYNDDEFGGAVRGRGGRGEDWALLSGCNGESPLKSIMLQVVHQVQSEPVQRKMILNLLYLEVH